MPISNRHKIPRHLHKIPCQIQYVNGLLLITNVETDRSKRRLDIHPNSESPKWLNTYGFSVRVKHSKFLDLDIQICPPKYKDIAIKLSPLLADSPNISDMH